MKHIFLVGAKSLGAYGGYETFVDKLTEYHKNDFRLKYHVACKANGQGAMDSDKIEGADFISSNTFIYHNAECYMISVPEKLGHAQAIYYDCKALAECIKRVQKSRKNNIKKKNVKKDCQEKIKDFVVYVMACRIGVFFPHYVKKIHKLGGKVYLNPDGHEWKRAKWNWLIRKYWKESEKIMVKHSDLIICDSLNIEQYIRNNYKIYRPKTTFIAYGAETRESVGVEEKYKKWLKENDLQNNEYYLIVGRFVPENNYETMIREFMKSKSIKNLAIITNINESFLKKLENNLRYKADKRIKFVGTVYDQELLMKIREQAYGYLHGHEVGGTNPSLLEALSSTKLNLLLNVGFNREVAKDAALYWNKKNGNLAKLIDKADKMSEEQIKILEKKAKDRIRTAYSWKFICNRYAEEFLKG